MPWEVVFYSLPSGHQPVLAWLKEQAPAIRAAFAHTFDLLEDQGTRVGMPHVKPLGRKLYELRVRDQGNSYRTLYFAASGQRFVMLHAFHKKTQKTPKQDLDKAVKRIDDFLSSDTPPMP